jgi:hypothetical protein
MTAVVAPPNLSAHKSASDRTSGDDDRPYMPSCCRCWAFAQSKGEANGHHSWAFNPPPATKVTNNRFDDHVFNPCRHKIHSGLTGHSGQRNPGFSLKRYYWCALRHFCSACLSVRTELAFILLVVTRLMTVIGSTALGRKYRTA